MLFDGNSSANKAADAIYIGSNAILNLNAGNFGRITFNDSILGLAANSSTININKSGDVTINGAAQARPEGGEVIFNDNVSNALVNLYSGTLTMGTAGNFVNSDLNLNGGTFNLANGSIQNLNLNNFTSAAGAKVNIDADLSSGASDSITAPQPPANSQ